MMFFMAHPASTSNRKMFINTYQHVTTTWIVIIKLQTDALS